MDTNQRSPEQGQKDTNRHTPSKEDATKQIPKKTDAEIEETERTANSGGQPKKTGARVADSDDYDAGSINEPDENSEQDTKDTI